MKHFSGYLQTDDYTAYDKIGKQKSVTAIGCSRKNYLFAGSHEGAERAALVYTLMANAKLQRLEPFYYIRDVLSRIADRPHKQINDILAGNWKTVNKI